MSVAVLIMFACYSSFDVAAALRFLGLSLGVFSGDSNESGSPPPPHNNTSAGYKAMLSSSSSSSSSPTSPLPSPMPPAIEPLLHLISNFLDRRPMLLNVLAIGEPIALCYALFISFARFTILPHFIPFLLLLYWVGARHRYSAFAKYAWSCVGNAMLMIWWDRSVQAGGPRRLKAPIQRLQNQCLRAVEVFP